MPFEAFASFHASAQDMTCLFCLFGNCPGNRGPSGHGDAACSLAYSKVQVECDVCLGPTTGLAK